jgi:hypothetical protein
MDRALSSGPIVWFGIIVTTCLLLVLFQTVLWLVVPILLAVVSYYVLSPLVNMAMARGLTRPRSVLIVTAMLCVFLVALGALALTKIPVTSQNWRDSMTAEINDYANSGITLLLKARNTLTKYSPFQHPSPVRPTSVGIVGVNAESAPVSDNDAFRQSISDMIDRSSGDTLLALAHWIPTSSCSTDRASSASSCRRSRTPISRRASIFFIAWRTRSAAISRACWR